MFHFTIFAGTEARLTSEGFTSVTVFGSIELIRPTIAQRVMRAKEPEEQEPETWFDKIRADNRNIALTLFGSTELRHPSLIEEYSALRALLTSGTIDKQELTGRIQDMLANERNSEELTSLTLFGAFEDSPIGRNKQLKALAAAEKAGFIPAHHKRRLDEIVDSPTSGMQVIGSLVPEMA